MCFNQQMLDVKIVTTSCEVINVINRADSKGGKTVVNKRWEPWYGSVSAGHLLHMSRIRTAIYTALTSCGAAAHVHSVSPHCGSAVVQPSAEMSCHLNTSLLVPQGGTSPSWYPPAPFGSFPRSGWREQIVTRLRLHVVLSLESVEFNIKWNCFLIWSYRSSLISQKWQTS